MRDDLFKKGKGFAAVESQTLFVVGFVAESFLDEYL